MTSYKSLFPSKYLRAIDLDGSHVTVTIDRVDEDEWIGSGQDAEQKPTLYFSDDIQPLVLNKTNAAAIGDLHGEDFTKWGGKRVVLYPTRVQFRDKMVDAIRVREVAESQADEQKIPATAAADAGDEADAIF